MHRLTRRAAVRYARGAFAGLLALWLVGAACRGTSDSGDVIIEPVTATPTSSVASDVTPVATPTAAATVASSPTPTPAAAEPTRTLSPTAVTTPTPAPSASPSPAPAAAATPTPADTPTPTPTPPPTPTPYPVEPTATTGALAVEELPVIEFVRGDGSVAALAVEVPPRSEYSIGLSGRYELGERGMLFHYPDAERARPFWMRNTHIDLDIAFAGADFVIIDIRRMTADTDDFHRPDRGYMYAVEAPAGWYEANGIAVGDVMWLRFELPEE